MKHKKIVQLNGYLKENNGKTGNKQAYISNIAAQTIFQFYLKEAK